MAQFIVTGGAGFIGSHIAEALINTGRSVTIIDDLSTGNIKNIEHILSRVNFVQMDIREKPLLRKLIKGSEAVFHQAAIPSVARSFDNPEHTLSVNASGTAILLEACRLEGVQKVIFASSSSVYGDTPVLPKEESMSPQPKSPYAISKLAGEHLMKIYSQQYNIETISLRYFNVFGPRQDPESEYAAVIPRFITRMLKGHSPVVFGDGKQSRDFCYIKNVVNANLLCLEKSNLGGQVINVACGRRITLLELIRIINEKLGSNLEPEFDKPRPGDVKHSLASIKDAENTLGYKVLYHVEEGLKETIEYFKRNT